MSIRLKLSLVFSLIVASMLAFHSMLFYSSSQSELRADLEKRMLAVSQQMAASIEQVTAAKRHLYNSLGERLRTVAIAVQAELDPDIAHVTGEQLANLSRRFGVDHIALFARAGDGIALLRSSDPKNAAVCPSMTGFRSDALNLLFEGRAAAIAGGQRLPHYWAEPLGSFAAELPDAYKCGYYYDGTTNYIIDPYTIDQEILAFARTASPERIVSKWKEENSFILEVTGFDPAAFAKQTGAAGNEAASGELPSTGPGVSIPFGTYTYRNESADARNVARAAATGAMFAEEQKLADKTVIKSFVPVMGETPYVIGLVSDYRAIRHMLVERLYRDVAVSVSLLILLAVAIYYIIGTIVGHKLKKHKDQLQDAAEELRSTKEVLESFVNYTTDAIHVVDLNGRVLQANRAFETLFGWSRAEVIGCTPRIVPERFAEEAERMNEKVKQGEQVTAYDTERLRHDGSAIAVSVTVSPIRNAEGNIVALASITRNITERKQTEEILRRSEKLSVVGQLAAGVAHEIRNPLTTLRGFVQLQKMKRESNPEQLELMLSELDRINLIVSEFLILAKPQVVQFLEHDPRIIVSETVQLLEPQANMSNIAIVTDFIDPLPRIRCESNQMKQVFINILKNGMEAMPNGGEMTIQVRRIDPDHIMVRFIDQGCGIREEHLGRLGEPFFTSKESGNGLGLMVSQQIIAAHKGAMHVSSEVGKGTCVDVVLPVTP